MPKKTAKSRQAAVEIEGKPQPLDIDRLVFDPENPRTVERLGADASQRQIEEFLLGGEMKARDLVPSFTANGYIPYEPLIVKSREKGNFVVVEGNRRLAALRSMKNSEDEEEKATFERRGLNQIPCLIFEGDERQLLA